MNRSYNYGQWQFIQLLIAVHYDGNVANRVNQWSPKSGPLCLKKTKTQTPWHSRSAGQLAIIALYLLQSLHSPTACGQKSGSRACWDDRMWKRLGSTNFGGRLEVAETGAKKWETPFLQVRGLHRHQIQHMSQSLPPQSKSRKWLLA